jgi:hypothetical protein
VRLGAPIQNVFFLLVRRDAPCATIDFAKATSGPQGIQTHEAQE